MILQTGFLTKKQMTGGNVIEKEIPWGKLHEIAKDLKGELKKLYIKDSSGREYKRIVIEYEEDKECNQ